MLRNGEVNTNQTVAIILHNVSLDYPENTVNHMHHLHTDGASEWER
jgi:hypothetical protein